MNSKRIILHSDLNSFYASVEIMLNPELRGHAVAVCGAEETRHGIVLAKSDPAKRAGVKTGMTNWEAKRLCPELIICTPRHDEYRKYSELVKAIYGRFTDLIEPFGMDECWLDLTGCATGYNDGVGAAEAIREAVKAELGLTVSIGVSFNKIFAKLGSDMKKPDAVTHISEENFREKVWPLPVGELIYVGRATARKLGTYGIRTIGDLAAASPDFLKRLLGVNGVALWTYASGLDVSRVMHKDFHAPVKSIGHGVTCAADLETGVEVKNVIIELAQDIGRKLRQHEMCAGGVALTVRDNRLAYRQYRVRNELKTQSPAAIADCAYEQFARLYDWQNPVRALTVTAINLTPKAEQEQMCMFDDPAARRHERLDDAVEAIRSRFGKRAIYPACLLENSKLPRNVPHDNVLPGMMYS